MHTIVARDFMITKLVTLRPEVDVLEAVQMLLKNRISGAPVIGPGGEYMGIFSEKCCMHVLLDATYEQLPSNHVGVFMDTEARTISPDTQLLSIAQAFLLTNARRLPVVEDGILIGQVSRRDVIRAAMKELHGDRMKKPSLLYLSALLSREESPIS